MSEETAIEQLSHSDALGAAFNTGSEGEFDPLATLSQVEDGKDSFSDPEDEADIQRIISAQQTEAQPAQPEPELAPAPDPETKKAQERKADEAEDRWAERFNKLARQEAELRRQRAEVQESAKQNAELAELKRQLAENPAQAIARLGIRPEQIYEENIKDRANEPLRAVEELKAQMQRELAEVRQETQRLALRRDSEAWDNEFSTAYASEDYAVVRAWYGDPDAIIEHVADTYRQTGKFLTPKQLLGTLKEEIESRVGSLESAGYVSRAAKAEAARTAQASHSGQNTESARKRKTLSTNTTAVGAEPVRSVFGMDDDADMETLIAKYSTL